MWEPQFLLSLTCIFDVLPCAFVCIYLLLSVCLRRHFCCCIVVISYIVAQTIKITITIVYCQVAYSFVVGFGSYCNK